MIRIINPEAEIIEKKMQLKNKSSPQRKSIKRKILLLESKKRKILSQPHTKFLRFETKSSFIQKKISESKQLKKNSIITSSMKRELLKFSIRTQEFWAVNEFLISNMNQMMK